MAYREADGLVEALELEEGEAPGRPGARVGDVEVVPPRHGGEPGGGVPGHRAPEGGRQPVEGAGVGDLVQRRPSHLNPRQESRQSTWIRGSTPINNTKSPSRSSEHGWGWCLP
jgi:hypothetical protein